MSKSIPDAALDDRLAFVGTSGSGGSGTFDDATILASVRRTRRAVIVDEGWRTASLAAEIGLRIVEQGFYDLDAPVARVCSEEVPVPYPKHLEEAALPSVTRIVAAVRRLFSDAQ